MLSVNVKYKGGSLLPRGHFPGREPSHRVPPRFVRANGHRRVANFHSREVMTQAPAIFGTRIMLWPKAPLTRLFAGFILRGRQKLVDAVL